MSKRAASYSVATDLASKREEFDHATSSGKWFGRGSEFVSPWGSQAPNDVVDHLRRCIAEDNVYVIFSYNTPIMWSWDTVYVRPAHKYSVTTSKQQGKYAAALHNHFDDVTS